MKKSLKIASISMLLSLCVATAACDNQDAAKTETTSEVKVDETNKNATPATAPVAAPVAAEKPADATAPDAAKAETTKTEIKTEETTKTK